MTKVLHTNSSRMTLFSAYVHIYELRITYIYLYSFPHLCDFRSYFLKYIVIYIAPINLKAIRLEPLLLKITHCIIRRILLLTFVVQSSFLTYGRTQMTFIAL